MRDVTLNPLDQNQRKLLQWGVVLLLLMFLVIYFFVFQRGNQSNNITNNTVTLEGTKLQVFNDTYTFNGYPDKILVHYPYFLLVQAEKPLTIIYNLETQKKEKEIQEVLLDYYKGNVIYNKKTSFYNSVNLDKYCDSAFIKNNSEILCTYRQNQDSPSNILIRINPDKPSVWSTMYQPPKQHILTTVSVIHSDTYIGEIDFNTKKSYVTVNTKTIPVDNVVNIIYPLKDQVYFASFQSNLNNQQENYYIIEENQTIRQLDSKIVFYKD